MKYFSSVYHAIILDVKFQTYEIVFNEILQFKSSFGFVSDSWILVEWTDILINVLNTETCHRLLTANMWRM